MKSIERDFLHTSSAHNSFQPKIQDNCKASTPAPLKPCPCVSIRAVGNDKLSRGGFVPVKPRGE